MSYNRGYQGGSPWASGAPPQMYGGPPPPLPPAQPQHTGYGGAPAYGTPQVAPPNYGGYGRHQMGPNPINAPVPPVWGQGPIGGGGGGPMPMNHQRGGNMRAIGGPTGKRSGHWNDSGPNKRFNRNRGQGNVQGGNNNNNNRKDGRGKFDNRHNFPRDNRNKQNKQGGKGNDNNEKKQAQKNQTNEQQEKKEPETLEKKEYKVNNAATKENEKTTEKVTETVETIHTKYVVTVTGYCCKLCDVFIRDKPASVEHCESESHMEKYKKAEEEEKERLNKEKEEQQSKQNEQETKDEKQSPTKTNCVENGEVSSDTAKTAENSNEKNGENASNEEEKNDDAEEK